jgi:hypothetical protein
MYVPNYKYDVFVSYAHVDDTPFPDPTKDGWVTTFVKCLKTRLAQKLGRSDAYSLWMDHELGSGQYISEQLINSVRDSATLIVVLSPGYVASSWCQRERDTFLRLIRESSNRPVFIVERERVDDREHPKELTDRKVFHFWVQKRDGKAPRVLGYPYPDPSDHEYYNQIDDLCQDIVTELKRLRFSGDAFDNAPLASIQPATVPVLQQQSTVFLAQVTDDLDPQRNSIKRYLDQAGIQVLPTTWYSQEPKAFRECVERDLLKSDLFVQLISETGGKKPIDLPQGYPKFQMELALAAGKPILQWRSPTLDVSAVDDKEHRVLLDAVTVHAEGLEDFKLEILRQLFEHSKPAQSKKKSIYVFVDMESADRPFAEQICDILDRYGVEYVLPIQSEDPADNRRDLEQNLIECDALIVIYGTATNSWVRGQLREAHKAVAMRPQPLRALAVIEGPPEQKAPLDMKIQDMRVLDYRAGISESKVKQFLDSLVALERGL